MAFIDTRLNARVRSGFVGGPRWNTLRKELLSGRNRRKKLWTMPRFEFTADYATFTSAEQREIYNAFLAAGGSWASFRFKDWNDFTATNEPQGFGDGTSAPKQLIKSYAFGAASYTRVITLPLAVTVYENGTPKAVTVNPLTGMVTPTTPWTNGAAITATFEFDVRVTFADDFNPFTAVASNVRECTVKLIEEWA